MTSYAPHELGVMLLSFSFLPAVVFGVLVGYFKGMLVGTSVGALVIAGLSGAAAWVTWQGGDQPDRGYARVTGEVVPAPIETWSGTEKNAAPTNHDLLIRYPDTQGRTREIPASYAAQPLAVGDSVRIDYPNGQPDRAKVVDPREHVTLLMVFVLFALIPLAMGIASLAWYADERGNADRPVRVRPPAVRTFCRWARVLANLAFLAGFVVALSDTTLASMAGGFTIIGYAALAHAIIARIDGLRAGPTATYFVMAVGFIAFGQFARLAA